MASVEGRKCGQGDIDDKVGKGSKGGQSSQGNRDGDESEGCSAKYGSELGQGWESVPV